MDGKLKSDIEKALLKGQNNPENKISDEEISQSKEDEKKKNIEQMRIQTDLLSGGLC